MSAIAVSSPKLVPFTISVLTDNSLLLLPSQGMWRLSVVSWKTPQSEVKNPDFKRRSSICVAVPIVVSSFPHSSILSTALVQAVNDMQDAVVRDYVNALIEADTSVNLIGQSVPRELLTDEGIAAWFANKSVNGRLSKDAVFNWFDTVLAGTLTDKLSALPGIDEEKLLKAVQQHRKLLADLASPRAQMPEVLAGQLRKALLLVPGDKVRESLLTRIDGFLKPKSSLELELGL